MIKRYGPWRCRLLAEKVETRQEFLETRKAGFVYFQGYFFRRPELMTAREIPANRLNYLRMLQAVSQPELGPKEIENVIKSEASICYRLLRYLNSVVFGFPSEIHSVRHALSILGEREVRRLAVLSGAASPLRPLYQLMLARESGEWQDTTHLTRTMRLSESEVAEVYWQAMQWARQVNAE